MAKIQVKNTVWAVVRRGTDKDPQYLVARRSKEVNNPGKYGFFGGTVDKDEQPLKALKRELLEESNLRVAKCYKLFTVSVENRIATFYEVICKPGKVKLNNEHDECRYMTEDELRLKPLHYSVKSYLKAFRKKALTFRTHMIHSNLQQEVIAYADNQVVGGAKITLVNASMQDFHIKPEFRGNGYASQLMEYILALPTPPRKLTAQASLGSPIKGQDLINFYSKYGFQVVSGNNVHARMEIVQ